MKTRDIVAGHILFHHMIKEGDTVIADLGGRRERGTLKELIVKHPNPGVSCQPHGVFKVELEDGSKVELQPEYLTRIKPR